jgi:predicted GNAT family N-acyltransferase
MRKKNCPNYRELVRFSVVYFSTLFLKYRKLYSVNSINQLVFVMETHCVFSEVETETLNITYYIM